MIQNINMNKHRFAGDIKENKKEIVTYIMSSSFRLQYNHGLKMAIEMAEDNYYKLQIILLRSPEENPRNNLFFQKGITGYQGFLSHYTNSIYYFEELTDLFYSLIGNSRHVIKDRAYLKEHRILEESIQSYLRKTDVALTLVESNVLVPVLYASNKEEYSARTFRNRVMSKIEEFLDIKQVKSPTFLYEQEAKEILHHFIQDKLHRYDQRNDPSNSYTSELSPYLKYGFISPMEIYIQVHNSGIINADLFIEELVVRRELSFNFVYYNKSYSEFNNMTYQWAFDSMNIHINDRREHLYSIEDYKTFNTHDIYFNTAMKEMVHLGTMHGYMRMYWAKKIIEWSPNYIKAYETMKTLNNYYFLDGNTPNGYTGIAWTFGKHDRAWGDRPIFGKIRYMNQQGLKRKFNIDAYVSKIDLLTNSK